MAILMMRFVYLIRLQLVLNKQKVPGARHLVLTAFEASLECVTVM